jgi:hypothetical protein
LITPERYWEHGLAFTYGAPARSALLLRLKNSTLWLSPAVILTISPVMTFVSLWYSPETKHLQLHEAGERERASDPAKDPTGLPDTVFAD